MKQLLSSLLLIAALLCIVSIAYSLPSRLNEIHAINNEPSPPTPTPTPPQTNEKVPDMIVREQVDNEDNSIHFEIYTKNHGIIDINCVRQHETAVDNSTTKRSDCSISRRDGGNIDDIDSDDIDSDNHDEFGHLDNNAEKNTDEVVKANEELKAPTRNVNTMQYWGYPNRYPNWGHHHHHHGHGWGYPHWGHHHHGHGHHHHHGHGHHHHHGHGHHRH